MEKPIVNKTILLQKYPGKGGWTFAALPKLNSTKGKSFGMLKVKGSIDSYEFKGFHVMPMKPGILFLPIKAEIRKKIKKEAGDSVKIVLYEDHESFEVPIEFLTCLKDEAKAETYFFSLTEGEQKNYVRWVYSAKKEETKIKRMATSINRLFKNLKFSDLEK